jgi:broad specificity phosphatase PhoE
MKSDAGMREAAGVEGRRRTTRFVLIRHGETDWNREGRWQGQADTPLNRRGVEQAARLADDLKRTMRVDAVYSSDLQRARQTAEAIAGAFGLPVRLDPRLREIHQGEWQGLLAPEIERRYQRIFQLRAKDPWSVSPPGGETAAQVRRRLEEALAEITAGHPGETVAIVSHGFILAVARVICSQEPVEKVWELTPGNCTPVVLACGNG